MTTTEEALAAFRARGGSVRKIETGASSGLTGHDWSRKVKGDEPSDNDLIAERHERGGVVYNGLGEIIGRL